MSLIHTRSGRFGKATRVVRAMPLRALLIAGLFTAQLLPADAEARIVHRERSLYSTILVDERGSLLCLQFSVRQDQRNQSCLDSRNPRRLVFAYAKMMLAGLLLNPDPQRILVVGLGGGTLPIALSELYPESRIDVVEIDPAVKTVAETYFGFAETEKMRVLLQDGRVFTKRAITRGDKYDFIMLDAFNGDYIPEHLMTREYLEETRALMTDDGVVISNTFAISELYDHESVTYEAVFGTFFNVRDTTSANRIIIAVNGDLPDRATLSGRALQLAMPLRTYDMRIADYPPIFSTAIDWDQNARVLTDQYAPVNLLREQ